MHRLGRRRMITQYGEAELAFIDLHRMFIREFRKWVGKDMVPDDVKLEMIHKFQKFFDLAKEEQMEIFDLHILPHFDEYLTYESKINGLIEAVLEELPTMSELEIKLGRIEKHTFEFTGEWKSFYSTPM
jgi:hypothetical protein